MVTMVYNGLMYKECIDQKSCSASSMTGTHTETFLPSVHIYLFIHLFHFINRTRQTCNHTSEIFPPKTPPCRPCFLRPCSPRGLSAGVSFYEKKTSSSALLCLCCFLGQNQMFFLSKHLFPSPSIAGDVGEFVSGFKMK